MVSKVICALLLLVSCAAAMPSEKFDISSFLLKKQMMIQQLMQANAENRDFIPPDFTPCFDEFSAATEKLTKDFSTQMTDCSNTYFDDRNTINAEVDVQRTKFLDSVATVFEALKKCEDKEQVEFLDCYSEEVGSLFFFMF